MHSLMSSPLDTPDAGGLEAIRILLKDQQIHWPPPDTIPSDGAGHTWFELRLILERVCEIECCPLFAASSSEWWNWLVNRLQERPVMVALGTEWAVALRIKPDNGRIVVFRRGSRQKLSAKRFRELWNQAGNLAVRVLRLRRDVVSRFDYFTYIPQMELKPIAGFMEKYPDPPADFARIAARYKHLNAAVVVTEWNVRLIGKMFWHLGHTQEEQLDYWEILKEDGGLAGYELYLHELVRMGWFFEREIDPCSAWSNHFWDIEHVLSLITTMRLLQDAARGRALLRAARTSLRDFSVCELVLANSLNADREDDWSAIVRFDASYPYLRPEDSRVRPRQILEAGYWYRANNYPRQALYQLVRNLQSIARWAHYDFSLRELILANPLSSNAESDWFRTEELNSNAQFAFLNKKDLIERPDRIEAARHWYGESVYVNRPFSMGQA
jgi:hypothetical protein